MLRRSSELTCSSPKTLTGTLSALSSRTSPSSQLVSFESVLLCRHAHAIGIPNLFVLETLSSIKVADLLQKSLTTGDSTHTLNVYLQVNTSGEESKSGLSPSDSAAAVVELAKHISEHCDRLAVLGLMTIGSWDASHTDDPDNPDFAALKRVREDLKQQGIQGKDGKELELSMGMSADFVQAIKQGSSSVRVGTRIFGERPKKSGA